MFSRLGVTWLRLWTGSVDIGSTVSCEVRSADEHGSCAAVQHFEAHSEDLLQTCSTKRRVACELWAAELLLTYVANVTHKRESMKAVTKC